jgi:hypothetical protein
VLALSFSDFDPRTAIVNGRVLRRTIYAASRLRGIAINQKRVKQLALRRRWVTLATPRRGEPAPGLELRFGLISRILSRRHAWEHSAARSAPMPWLVHDARRAQVRG